MIYSEYLPRVDSVSVFLDFDEQVKDINQIFLESDDVLKVVTKVEYSITLAHRVKQLKIQRLNLINSCLQITLLVGDVDSTTNNDNVDSFLNTHLDKWSCKDLQRITPKIEGSNVFEFTCKYCQSVIVNSKEYKFLDMPSEYWYEFMDYWHCHKPHSDEKYDKNYGQLKPPNEFTVLLGSHYLLLHENDNLTTRDGLALCKKCQKSLGVETSTLSKLFKWNLQLNYDGHQQQYPYRMFLYNLIVDKVNSHAARKFSFEFDNKIWYLWVTNIGLDVSINLEKLKNTLKMLYYYTDLNTCENDSEYESIDIPSEIRCGFIEMLTSIAEKLPMQMRTVVMGKQTFSVTNFSV